MKITRNQDIDRMRGLTVFLMLVVNSPVDLRITNSALIHSEWAGLSLADTVFPTFLFIVGISLTLSNRLKKITLRGLFIRSTVLVLTGIFLKAIVFVLYDQEHFKIMGVLQRIGICYGVTGLIYHFISNKKLPALCLALILAWSAILMVWGDYNQYANISDVVDDLLLGAHANYYNTDTGRSGD
ncbi:heparan-alpha-glucosaminide N-acetyltransferase domain-containing protein [Klebsiella oxytoca]